ncbi:hypothetical protein O1611_g2561 [Lasiodiplodia mahajangana]|uniref:Uncharacterized protein n=1 Tax=Lasiodiplodia mahajangana TaxID=1108764 RepID=A0ACC2JUQ7_9PEZI|nr:hypothetical protein O1611_g2561 [Lasiodiplodia mahajangana]
MASCYGPLAPSEGASNADMNPARSRGKLDIITAETSPRIDIVLVSEVVVDSSGPWTWVQYLPTQINRARIMAFTYSYGNVGDGTSILSPERITQVAEELLSELLDIRPPIAFVAHDIGGAIVKKALVLAEKHPQYYSISEDCSHITFFRTPHRIEDLRPRGESALNIALASPPPLSVVFDIADRMRVLSIFLNNLSSDFISLRLRRSIINIYQKAGTTEPSPNRTIVDKYSTTSGLIHEISVGLLSSHQEAFEFSEFKPIYSIIVNILKAEMDCHYQACLSCLFDIFPAFAIPDDVQILSASAYKAWALRDYDEWLKHPSPPVNSTIGGSGSGKHLIASALFHKLKNESRLTVYFSFTETDARRSSATSFLSSAVFQVLCQEPGRFPRIRDLFIAIHNSKAWTYANLLNLFRFLLDTKPERGPLYLIVDGFHRCTQSSQSLLEELLAMAGDEQLTTPMNIALFSQKRDGIEKILATRKSLCLPEVILSKGPALSRLDIAPAPATQVIKEWAYLANPALQSHIAAVLGRCKSTMDVSLTMQALSRVCTDQNPLTLGSLASLLDSLPLSMPEAAAFAFKALQDWARVALGWICLARRPLSVRELSTAIGLTSNINSLNMSVDEEKLYVNVAPQLETALGPFLRIEKGSVLFKNDDTRKCFLRLIQEERQQGSTMDQNTRVAILDDSDITKFLLEYLSWPRFVEPIEKALQKANLSLPPGRLFDLTAYAVQFLPAHYLASECYSDILELAQNPRIVWIWRMLNFKLNNISRPLNFRATLPIYLAVQMGLANLVQSQKTTYREDLDRAIDLASWGGHLSVVEILLRDAPTGHEFHTEKGLEHASARGYDEIVSRLLTSMEESKTLSSTQLEKLICQAAALGHENQVFLFHKAGAHIDAAPDGITPLQHATCSGHASVVFALLDRGRADPNSDVKTIVDKPLILAATRGYELIARHLILFNADVARVDDNGRSPLFHAAQNNHEVVVNILLEYAHNHSELCESIIDHQDRHGITPLIMACREGRGKIATLLLDAGARLEMVDKDGHTALYYAIKSNNEPGRLDPIVEFLDIGKALLRAAELGHKQVIEDCLTSATNDGDNRLCNFSRAGDGDRALHIAAEKGYEDIVRLLIEFNADINALDEGGRTPLISAAIAGEVDIVSLLLEHRANVDQRMAHDQTVLSYVVRMAHDSSRHAEIVEKLLATEIDPNALDNFELVALHWAVDEGKFEMANALLQHHRVDVTATGRYDMNALHYLATANGKVVNMAQALIEAGVNPMQLSSEGWLPLHVASKYGHVELMELLVKENPSSLILPSKDQRTALHFGVRSPKSLGWLLDRGLNVNARDIHGNTPLMLAIKAHRASSVRLLLKRDANVETTREDKGTVLHTAVDSGQLEIGRALLECHPTMLSCRDKTNLSALHYAICKHQFNFANMLLEEYYANIVEDLPGATREDLHAPETVEGATPLISAVKAKNQSVIRKLRKVGAATEHVDKNGKTALLLAVEQNDTNVLDALLDDIEDGVRPDINAGSRTQPTALHEAAWRGDQNMVQYLINHNAHITGQGGQFNTALSAAASRDWNDIARYFIDKWGQDAGVHLSGGNFANPLGAALSSRAFQLLPYLLDAKADINAIDAQGRSSFHIAASQGSWDAILQLRNAQGAKTPKADKQGRTLLHHAAMSRSVELFRNLLDDTELASPIDVRDVDGWTPLHWACRQNDTGIVQLICEQKNGAVIEATRHGWTPENVAMISRADDAADFIKNLRQDLVERGKHNTIEEDVNMEASNPAGKQLQRGRRWKVGYEHSGVGCDGCFLNVHYPNQPVVGILWRCINCQDFKYCFKCFWTAKETHDSEHQFKAMPEWGEDRRDPETEEDSEQEVEEEGRDNNRQRSHQSKHYLK